MHYIIERKYALDSINLLLKQVNWSQVAGFLRLDGSDTQPILYNLFCKY